jgi:plastocyanin
VSVYKGSAGGKRRRAVQPSSRWLRWLRRLLIPVAITSALGGWVVSGAIVGPSDEQAGEFEAGGLLLTVHQTERLAAHDMSASTEDELDDVQVVEGTEADVTALDGSFDADNIQITPGTTVTWTNQGQDAHDVVPVEDNAPWGVDLANFGPGTSYEYTFGEAGIYRYVCTVHPNMIGQVVVGEAVDVEAADADSNGIFSMPNSMTPGMQAEDEDRIHVEVTLRNPSDTVKDYRPDDFRLVSSSGDAWPLNPDTLVPATLAADYATNLDLYFDVPMGREDLSIEWSVGGSTADIPLGLGDQGDGHDDSDDDHSDHEDDH